MTNREMTCRNRSKHIEHVSEGHLRGLLLRQQVSEIDYVVRTQLNTKLTLELGDEDFQREAVRAGPSDIGGFAPELQVLTQGQLLLSSRFKEIALPVQVSHFDARGIRDGV